MIGTRKVLGIIPARGGSKGLPGKNLMSAAGRPLIAFSIHAARGAASIDRVVVSSDDPAILAAAREHGAEVPFVRPAALATDEAPTLDVVLHALEHFPEFEIVVLLQPTSPLRSAADIDAACALFAAAGTSSCVSVCPVEQSPYWMYTLDSGSRMVPILAAPVRATRRQDLPAVYTLNGAIYITTIDSLRERRAFTGDDTIAYIMPPERSIDIDTMDDFDAFRKLLTEDDNAQVPGPSRH